MEPFLIPVLAQQVLIQDGPSLNPSVIIIPVVAMLIPIIVAPTAMLVRLARQKRELEHRERMMALELGRDVSGENAGQWLGRLAVKISTGVPVSAIALAWLATMSSNNSNHLIMAWIMAGSVGLASVVSGGILAVKAAMLRAEAEQHDYAAMTRKPSFDPDAYDHVGSRG